jgi:hypothetical protein
MARSYKPRLARKKSTLKSVRKPRRSTRKSVRKPRRSNRKSVRKPRRSNRKSVRKPRRSNRKSVRKPRRSNRKSVRKPRRSNRKSVRKPRRSTRKSVQRKSDFRFWNYFSRGKDEKKEKEDRRREAIERERAEDLAEGLRRQDQRIQEEIDRGLWHFKQKRNEKLEKQRMEEEEARRRIEGNETLVKYAGRKI